MNQNEHQNEADAQRSRLLFEHSIDAIFILDDQGRCLDANPAACEMTGASREQLRCMGIEDLQTASGLSAAERFAGYLEMGRDVGVFRFLHTDGREHTAEYSAFRGGPDQSFVVVRDITKQRDAERALSERGSPHFAPAETRLRLLCRHIIAAQERERRSVAREIHDEFGGILNTLSLNLSLLESQAAGDLTAPLAAVRSLSLALSKRARGISLQLRPSILDDFGVLPALQWHVSRLQQSAQIEVALVHRGLAGRLAPELETAIYRIVEAALSNVVRHGGVRHATVRLWADPRSVGVQVVDYGVGFDPAAARGGTTLGLFEMQERTEILGGDFSVESAPGEGTCITAQFPLK